MSGHLPGHLSTLAGSAPKGLVPGQMWRSREAGGVTPAALTGAPSTLTLQPRRGGWAPGQPGQGGPPPGVSAGPLQKSLRVGGGGGQYIQKTKPREQTPPLYSPPPTRARLPGWDQPPARAQSLSKQPREQQSRACRPAGCPRPEALALYPRVHLSPTQPFGSCAYSNHDMATTP